LSAGQIKCLLEAYPQKGAAGLISKNRERTGNNCLLESVKKQALHGKLEEE